MQGPQAGRHRVYIGIGSNIGNKVDNCQRGIEAVGAVEGCRVVSLSPLYETEPVYFEDQDWFINGVAEVMTELDPETLFEKLKAIERRAGRRAQGVRFGPRVLDLDILLYDDCVLRRGWLEIPHPRLHERRFVLKPLCDLAAGLVHPVMGKSMQRLLSDLRDSGKKVTQYECDC